MPKDLPPDDSQALSNAERQARYRARKAEQVGTTIRYRRPADRRTRLQRWHDAVAELLALQADYTAWADALPDALRETATAEALQTIVDLDLTELADIKSPRGHGRKRRRGSTLRAGCHLRCSVVLEQGRWDVGSGIRA